MVHTYDDWNVTVCPVERMKCYNIVHSF